MIGNCEPVPSPCQPEDHLAVSFPGRGWWMVAGEVVEHREMVDRSLEELQSRATACSALVETAVTEHHYHASLRGRTRVIGLHTRLSLE